LSTYTNSDNTTMQFTMSAYHTYVNINYIDLVHLYHNIDTIY
jgi:hypothetical protein